MWVNKKEYELTKRMAENNEHDANLLRSLIHTLRENRIIHHSEFVMMSTEAYEILFKEACLQEDKCKELEAELEWYKVKYHEMKTSE